MAIAAVAVAPDGARAQADAPLRLGPSEPPAGAATVPPDRPPAPAPRSAPGIAAPDGILVQRLGSIDSEAVGLLGGGQGGLGTNVWRGSSRALIVDLLHLVPGTVPSPALRDLLRRLLLTTAPPPAIDDGDAGGSMVALRASLLVAMGEPADADALVAAASRQTVSAERAWPAFEARLLTGDAAGACRLVREQRDDLARLFWQKAIVFCQLLAERTDQAQFSLTLLREQQTVDDPLFFMLAEALAFGGSPRIGKAAVAGAATPLNLALLRMAWTDVPDWFAAQAPAGIVAAVARMPDLPEPAKLGAAIRAEAAGALPAADLRALFEAMKVTPQELAAALTIADTEPPARAVALLYLAARAQTVPAARAEVLQRLWEVAAGSGVAGTAARLAAPLLADIPLLPEFSWFAGTAGRIALFAGDLPRALGWYDVVAAASASDDEAATAATALWPLVRLALGNVRRMPPVKAQDRPIDPARDVIVVGAAVKAAADDTVTITEALPPQGVVALPWDRRRIEAWLHADVERYQGEAPARAGVLLALLDAVGDPVPDAAWRAALPPSRDAAAPAGMTAAGGAYRLGLDRAATAGRQGETILFAVATLAGRDAGSLDTDTMHAIADALVRAGFADHARAFARDAALAAGL